MAHQQIEAERLTIYCRESDHHAAQPLHVWIVAQALRDGLARAQALRAIIGYGRRRRMQSQSLLTISDDLPVRIEIIDTAGNIERFLDAHAAVMDRYTYLREQVRWHTPAENTD
ncbi:MAG: DUF190 domain-containing protein [Phycisphaerales bacterium]